MAYILITPQFVSLPRILLWSDMHDVLIAPIFMHGSIIAWFNQFLAPMSARNAWRITIIITITQLS